MLSKQPDKQMQDSWLLSSAKTRLGSAPLHTLATVMVLPQSWVLSSPGIFTATEASLTAMASRLTCRDSTPAVWCRAPGQFSFSPVGLTVTEHTSSPMASWPLCQPYQA
ncbi:mCG1028060 [Mus musculus]|nr:mCG1028060 [Mus musculus]